MVQTFARSGTDREGQKPIAFLDEGSRLLIGFSRLSEKIAASLTVALKSVLDASRCILVQLFADP
jgi:hypothetical protein